MPLPKQCTLMSLFALDLQWYAGVVASFIYCKRERAGMIAKCTAQHLLMCVVHKQQGRDLHFHALSLLRTHVLAANSLMYQK